MLNFNYIRDMCKKLNILSFKKKQSYKLYRIQNETFVEC